ncbi:sensor histidine kinase [Bounagaea algeriensis]
MIIPWIVVGVLWTIGCSLFAYDAMYTQRIGAGVRQLSLPAVSTMEALQQERQASLQFASRSNADPAQLDEARQRTDDAATRMQREADSLLESAPQQVRAPLQQLTEDLDRLSEVRSGITSGSTSVEGIRGYYDGVFDTASQLFSTQARIVPDTDTLQGAQSAAALFRASDLAAREASTVSVALRSGDLSAEQYRQLVSYINTSRAELRNAVDDMRPQTRQRFDELRADPAWQRLHDLENRIVEGGVFSGDDAPVDEQVWAETTGSVVGALSDMVRLQADGVSQQAVDKGNEALRAVAIGSAIALAVAVASFFIARRVYRAVVDEALLTRLQDLRTESLELAKRLPDLVRRIRDGQQIDPNAELTRLRQYGDDEVGQVANAIQVFHEEAVTAAVRETKARRGARAVFVGMSYRVQQLLRTMHGTIDDLERYEENSAQLSRLYELDNSTTRARRKVENLLVLGDQQPGRRWTKPVNLLDVLRAAVSEIDQYARVTIGHVPDTSVAGAAVGDTIHLVSELVDNAAAFSPPETQVQLSASLVARGVAIDVADQGLGMDERSRNWANEMMSSAPRFDQLVLDNNRAEQLGLFTAARLAERRSISVEFGVSAYGGTRATVLLGQHLLASRNSEDVPTAAVTVPAQPAEGSTKSTKDGSEAETERTALPEDGVLSTGAATEDPFDEVAAGAAATEQESGAGGHTWPSAEQADEAARGGDGAQQWPAISGASFSTRGSLPLPGGGTAAVPSSSDSSGEEAAPTGASDDDRPALPRRVPQSHLVEGLRDEPEEHSDTAIAQPSRLASFGRAFRSGVSSQHSSREQNDEGETHDRDQR